MGNLNFNAGLSSGNITRFFDNQPFTVGGFTYMDTVEVISDGGTTYSDYAGPNLWYDPYTGMTSGTITGIFAGTFSAGNLLVIQDIAVTAYALGSATATPSTADDYALFASIFQGSDLFLLSDKGDRAFGFGGNDTLKGYGGTDWLYGNQGNDLLQGQNSNDLLDGGQGRDKLTGGRGNDVFQFVSPRDGGDIITDFHNKRGDNATISVATTTAFSSTSPGSAAAGEASSTLRSSSPARPTWPRTMTPASSSAPRTRPSGSTRTATTEGVAP
jgi:Ca2+-binding RTX toxin-like protein